MLSNWFDVMVSKILPAVNALFDLTDFSAGKR